MLSRRSLLKTGLAGFGSFAIAAESYAVPTMASKKRTNLYDVVICGGGAGGLLASIRLAEKGKKVVLLEKLSIVGGSSAVCGGAFAVCNTDLQAKNNVKDSEELFVQDMLKVGKYQNDVECVKAFVHAGTETYNWLTQYVKPYELTVGAGMSVARSHRFSPRKVVEFLYAQAQKVGVKILLETKAEKLLWDEKTESICGVKATDADDKKISFYGKQGVILATGGFANNPKLVNRYAPSLKGVGVICAAGCNGDGLLMAQAYGADIADMDSIKATYGFRLPALTVNDMLQLYYSGAIIVNKYAKRFVDESKPYKYLATESLAQPDGASYVVFDDTIRKNEMKRMIRAQKAFAPVDEGKTLPWCQIGNSIEEVAKKVGLDAKVLMETIKDYNEKAPIGKDTLGRKKLSGAGGVPCRIEKGPFYIVPTASALFGTYCGIRITPKAEVIDVYNKPIKGLYAIGEITGGVHGAANMSGCGFGGTMAWGTIVAKTILSKKK